MNDLMIKQLWFTRFLGNLLFNFQSADITLGESWRSEETCKLYAKEGKGIEHSCHTMRLAQDLNILKGGSLSVDKSDYYPLAIYWKKLPSFYIMDIPIVTCWGGDFSKPDIFHFSIRHNGSE
jgi:hypothetical protein